MLLKNTLCLYLLKISFSENPIRRLVVVSFSGECFVGFFKRFEIHRNKIAAWRYVLARLCVSDTNLHRLGLVSAHRARCVHRFRQSRLAIVFCLRLIHFALLGLNPPPAPPRREKVLHHKIAFKTLGCVYFCFCERNKMINDAPLFIVPFQIVGTGCEVFAMNNIQIKQSLLNSSVSGLLGCKNWSLGFSMWHKLSETE